MYKPYRKRYITAQKSSTTLDAVLAYIYRKENLKNRCGKYADMVINGLVELDLVKKVTTKETFYFKTEKSKNFKAIDFAKEFLWAYHNTENRILKDGEKYIYCFDESIKDGRGLIQIENAIKRGVI